MKSIIFGNSEVTILDSLYITVVSLFIVFFILVLISFILSLFKYIPKENKNESINNNVSSSTTKENKKIFRAEDIKDEKMRIAVMVATMEATKENENSNIRIINVRELN